MFIFGNLILAIAQILDTAITIYIFVIIIRALLSWFNPNPYHPAVRFIVRITEPVLAMVRQFIPNLGGLDISPIIVIFGLYFIQAFVVKTLVQLAYYLQ